MAEGDVLIGEVNDAVRRDTFLSFLDKYKIILGAVIVGTVGFVAFEGWRSGQSLKDQQAQADAITLAIDADPKALETLGALKTQSAMSELMRAKLELAKGNKDAAIKIYTDVANSSSNLDTERELARLLSFSADETSEAGALINPGAVFELEANLILAQRKYAAGEKDAALEIVMKLMEDERAGNLRSLLESTVLAWGGALPETETPPSDTEEVDPNAQ